MKTEARHRRRRDDGGHSNPEQGYPLGGMACPPDIAAIVVMALIAAIAAATFRDYGLGWDDYTHAQYGDLLLAFYTSAFRDTRAFEFVNLYRYGGGFDMVAALLARTLPFDLFETRRLVGAAVGLFGLFVVWRMARRVGGPLAGLVALALLATCPLYYGHMLINSKDAPFAVAMGAALFGILRTCEEYPRMSLATSLWLGLGLGLAIGTRILGGFAVLTLLAAMLLLAALEARSDGLRAALARLARFLPALMASAAIAFAAMALVWPWAVRDPLNLPRTALYFSHFFEKPWRELFAGELILVPDMPRSYLPTLLGLQTPEIFLLLALAGLAGALAVLARPATPARRRAVYLSIALAALLPIALAVALRFAMYNGIRHFLFVLPPLALLGGLAGGFLLERLQRLGRLAAGAGLAVLLLALAPPVIEMVRLHPYQYVYFNTLAGGARGAEGHYMLDYWGLSFKQAAASLRAQLAQRGERPGGERQWKIAVCGPHAPAEVALGEQFDVTWEPEGADFAMMLGVFYCAKLDAPVLLEVKREGVLFARVYDIRGRPVRTLLAYPPLEN